MLESTRYYFIYSLDVDVSVLERCPSKRDFLILLELSILESCLSVKFI